MSSEESQSEPISQRPLPAAVDVAIIGSGFAGLGAAIQLSREGLHDYAVLERADDLGGTWRDNTYPGCRCDVPSHLYSYSFAPNPNWSRSFSPQPEIWAYLRGVADRYHVRDRMYFGAEVLFAAWDESLARWQITTARGSLTARVLISGQGPLSEPAIPALPGLENFRGTTFHSATWRHDYDLTGKRVAVIGTGASAIQFVPEIAPKVAHLTVFQRTAPWVMPRRDRAIGAAERALYRAVPLAQRLARAGIYWGREATAIGFTRNPRLLDFGEKQARAMLARQVPDPELRAALTPTFKMGCKRVLLSNDYYPALTRENVSVRTDRIVEVTETGVVTVGPDGTRTEHPVDALIFGTGFRVTDMPINDRIAGRGGVTLAEAWADGMAAYRGATVHGFPNLFLLVGPNTGLGHTSIVFMIEAQLRYVMDTLRQMRQQGLPALEVRESVQSSYNDWVQERSAHTVWLTGGCASWYLDSRGRNSTLWPDFTFPFRRQTRRCDLRDYAVVEPAGPAGQPATGAEAAPVAV